jgi:DNA-binding CsgD family transcriptional regulator
MNLVLFSLFSGINIAFALLGFFIYSKNRSQSMYLYFGVFSLFSGLYFLLQSVSEALILDLRIVIIFSAAMYYGIFPWFVFEFVGKKFNKALWFISLIFMIAFLVFILVPEEGPFAIWQIIAHAGLVGLIICIVLASVYSKKAKRPGSVGFIFISSLFVILAMEEMIRNYTGYGLAIAYRSVMPPLDVYPFLFTIAMGVRMSKDFVNRQRVEIEAIKNDLNEKELRVLELERLRLIDEVNYKKRDLTDFGIEITRKRNYIKEVMQRLTNIKKKPHIKTSDIDEIIKFAKAQLQIGQNLDYFHERIEDVNHQFTSKLKELYPTLTESELHLSSLLRLKLSTKEIANIKNVSPDSVKVLRYRLRKKFNLSTKTTLPEFLNKF